MRKKLKRASILAVIIYIMVNSFVWGLMKAYINSYNAVSQEKLAMAEITDSPEGKKVSVMGNSIFIPDEKEDDTDLINAVKMIIPSEIRAISGVFKQTVQEIVQELS